MFGYDEEEYKREVIEEARGYVTKDSGARAEHSDGVVRDTQAGKIKFPLLFPRDVPMKDQLFVRVAELYTRGGEKYGDRNWENSRAEDTLDHHREALWRHFLNFFFEVDDGEDHAAAIVWNINAVELTRRNLREDSEVKPEPQDEVQPELVTAEGNCRYVVGHDHRACVFGFCQWEGFDEHGRCDGVCAMMEAKPKSTTSIEGIPLLALKDSTGDEYWKPNDDGTFDCWAFDEPPNPDDGFMRWTQEDIEERFGPVETIYVKYEPLPWG